MTKIVVVRHGHSVFNLTRQFGGQVETPLSPIGEQQVLKARDYILSKYKIDCIYSSPLSRAYNTAKPIADALGLDIQTDERLMEVNLGDWDGRYIADVEKEFPEEVRFYRNGGNPPNGESADQVMERVYKAVQDIAKANEGKTVLIATHAGCIRGLTRKWQKKAYADVEFVRNASTTEALYERGEFVEMQNPVIEYLGEWATKPGEDLTGLLAKARTLQNKE